MPVITKSDELKRRIDALQKDSFVAIDTEFLREKTYYPLLCLVQIAGENDAFAIDTLCDIDLNPLFDLMENSKIVKVFHAASQDFEIILQHNDALPTPAYDTQIAAQVLGYGEAVGYGNLAEKMLKIKLDKSSRHTDWSKRPLSEKQIEYAMSDVTHLRDIYVKLQEELKARKRDKWANEEMQKIMDPAKYTVVPSEAWQQLRLGSRSKDYVQIVMALADWRERRAQSLNKPRNWILKNDAILELASVHPKAVKDMGKLRYLSTNNNPLKEEILQVIDDAKNLKAPVIERKKPLPKGTKPLMELLRILLRSQCELHDVAPSTVATTDDLEAVVRLKDPKRSKLACMKGWRYEIFGHYALALKDGKLALTADGGKIVLIEPTYES